MKTWRDRRFADPAYRERINKLANDRAVALRAYLDRVKMESGCVDCGYCAHPAALDFDHIEAKTILVSFCKSIKAADKEIAKCEVRCANCHRIKTWQRRREATNAPAKP